MESRFPLAPLGDYATVQIGFSFKSQDFTNVGVPVLKIKNVRLREVDTNEVDFVDKGIADTVSQYYAQNGDLLISMTGSGPQAPNSIVGRVARFAGTDRTYLINQRVGRFVIKKPEIIDQRYLFYVLIQPEYQHQLVAGSTGSANQANISIKQIVDLSIPVPSLPEQRAIAGILGALDDKIELNRRMNRTLESMARAVFRQWFVYNEDIYKWDMGYLSDIAYVVKGVSYRSADLVEDSDTALVTLKSMERGGGYREDGLKPFAGEYKLTQKLFPGEVVIAHTDLTQAADVIGRAARVESSEKHPNLVVSLDMAIVRPKEKPYTNEYLYGLLSQVEFSDHAYGYTNGTTVLHLSTKALPEYQFRIPPKSKVEKYSEFASPIFQQIDNNKKESRTLASLRDSLLPKLMRGEVRVK